jgi:hypothetical protein
MFLFDWFRSLLPLHNPIGFGASDFVEMTLAMLLVLAALARRRLEPLALRLAKQTGWSMLLLAALPVVLRLAPIARFPAPTPSGADDFSYLLLADTLRHFHLANPVHPMHRFFEAVSVLQQPSYSSIFPLGQGMALALGWMIFGHPWAGVVLSMAALCAGCYWMLRGWTTPGWALAGGLVAACEFGPLNQWMNLYWGGAVSGIAGCLVFGALPRLRVRQAGHHAILNAMLLGAGLGFELLTRPFEFLLLAASVVVYAVWNRLAPKQLAVAALALLPAVLLTLAQNRAVTGSFMIFPTQLSRYQYGAPAAFTIRPNPVPHQPLTPEQQLAYQAQSLVHGEGAGTLASWTWRLAGRFRFYRFFFYPPLYLVLPAFLLALGDGRFVWLAGTVLIFAAGENFYPLFYPHSLAALTSVFVLAGVTAAERLNRWSPLAARLVLYLCAAYFLFWYGLYCGSEPLLITAARYDTADFINYADPEGRIRINQELAGTAGRKLVFVRYGPQHILHEWIHNAADIDSADVVWAADLGDAEDQKLRAYYPTRSAWLVEPDARPPRLMPYP